MRTTVSSAAPQICNTLFLNTLISQRDSFVGSIQAGRNAPFSQNPDYRAITKQHRSSTYYKYWCSLRREIYFLWSHIPCGNATGVSPSLGGFAPFGRTSLAAMRLGCLPHRGICSLWSHIPCGNATGVSPSPGDLLPLVAHPRPPGGGLCRSA